MSAPLAGSITFSLEIGGEVQIKRRIEGLLANIADLGPALERMEAHFHAHLEQVFATEGGATASGHWAPLSERYLEEKGKSHPGRPILTRTEALRKAMTQRGAAGNVSEIGPQGGTFGAALRTEDGRWDLGLLHQKGAPRAHLPMRPIIDLPEAVKTEMVQALADHLWSER